MKTPLETESCRLLLEAEWAAGGHWGPSADDAVDSDYACFFCGAIGGPNSEGHKWNEPHKTDCRWMAVMKKAGLR